MALVEEAANADHENLVAWRGGCRWMRRFERLSLPPVDSSQLPLKRRGVYLITGGLGGIGLTVARWLVPTHPRVWCLRHELRSRRAKNGPDG